MTGGAISSPGYIFFIAPLLIISILAITLSTHVGIIKITNQEFSQQQIFAFDAIKASFPAIFKIFGLVLTAALLFTPIALVFGSITYVLIKSYDYTFYTINTLGINQLSLIILLIIIGLGAGLTIVGYITALAFSIQAMIVEEKGVIDAIKRSLQLVKKDYWKLFGSIILILLTTQAIGYSLEGFLGFVINILYFIGRFLNIQQDYLSFMSMTYSKVNVVVTIITYLIITPLTGIMITLLYYNQRFKKEGLDILFKLKEIQADGEDITKGGR